MTFETFEEFWKESFEKEYGPDTEPFYGIAAYAWEMGERSVRKNNIIWHDLRKDPEDVPEDDREVLNEIGIEVRYIGDCWVYVYIEETMNADVIAWCEIPEFNEEIEE